LQHAHRGWQRGARQRLARSSDRLSGLTQNLAHLNPQAVLERGYSIVAGSDGTIVQDARQVRPGDPVALTFARGGADATIDGVKPAG
jgi:exodeoxyribonuclease VII large subunit